MLSNLLKRPVKASSILAAMHPRSTLAILFFGTLHATQAYKPCRDYEVGVGTTETCGITDGCGAVLAVVTTSDCTNNLGLRGNSGDLCGTDYSRGWKVSCSGGNPSVVSNSNGQRWGNCYRASNGYCGLTSGINSIHKNVYWCCQEL